MVLQPSRAVLPVVVVAGVVVVVVVVEFPEKIRNSK